MRRRRPSGVPCDVHGSGGAVAVEDAHRSGKEPMHPHCAWRRHPHRHHQHNGVRKGTPAIVQWCGIVVCAVLLHIVVTVPSTDAIFSSSIDRCVTYVRNADANRDGILVTNEFLQLIVQFDTSCEEESKQLSDSQLDKWLQLGCDCRKIVFAEPDCCTSNEAALDVAPAWRDLDDLSILQEVGLNLLCSLTQNLVSELVCGDEDSTVSTLDPTVAPTIFVGVTELTEYPTLQPTAMPIGAITTSGPIASGEPGTTGEPVVTSPNSWPPATGNPTAEVVSGIDTGIPVVSTGFPSAAVQVDKPTFPPNLFGGSFPSGPTDFPELGVQLEAPSSTPTTLVFLNEITGEPVGGTTVPPSTFSPTTSPTEVPTTLSPTTSPTTVSPTLAPTTLAPTISPTETRPFGFCMQAMRTSDENNDGSLSRAEYVVLLRILSGCPSITDLSTSQYLAFQSLICACSIIERNLLCCALRSTINVEVAYESIDDLTSAQTQEVALLCSTSTSSTVLPSPAQCDFPDTEMPTPAPVTENPTETPTSGPSVAPVAATTGAPIPELNVNVDPPSIEPAVSSVPECVTLLVNADANRDEYLTLVEFTSFVRDVNSCTSGLSSEQTSLYTADLSCDCAADASCCIFGIPRISIAGAVSALSENSVATVEQIAWLRNICDSTQRTECATLTPTVAPTVAVVTTELSSPPIETPVSRAPQPNPTSTAPQPNPSSQAPVRTPTSDNPVEAPISDGPTRAPASRNPTRAPATSSPLRTPQSDGPTKAPESSSPVVAPQSSAPTLAPRSNFPTRAPRSNLPTRAPQSNNPTRDLRSPGPTKVPWSQNPTSTPRSAGPTQAPRTGSPIVLAAQSEVEGDISLANCITNLLAADTDTDDLLTREEYLKFVIAESECELLSFLSEQQSETFQTFSCKCLQEDNASENCCLTRNARIAIDGARLPAIARTKTQQRALEEVCSATKDVISGICTPHPTPSPTLEPTHSPTPFPTLVPTNKVTPPPSRKPSEITTPIAPVSAPVSVPLVVLTQPPTRNPTRGDTIPLTGSPVVSTGRPPAVFFDQPTESPVRPPTAYMIDRCLTSMVEGDENQDGVLSMDEFFVFIQSYGGCYLTTKLSTDQNNVFFTLACACIVEAENNVDCCLPGNAEVPIYGANATLVGLPLSQLEHLSEVCSRSEAALEDECLPTPTDPPLVSDDLDQCSMDLLQADTDGDSRLDKDEYLSFIQTFGNCDLVTALDWGHEAVFQNLACNCVLSPGSTYDCCLPANARLNIDGAKSPEADRTIEQTSQLSKICISANGLTARECTAPEVESLPSNDCASALVAADYDGNGSINDDEFLQFIQMRYSECETIPSLSLSQRVVYNVLACTCLFEPGAELSCCTPATNGFKIDGASLSDSERTSKQANFLSAVCKAANATVLTGCQETGLTVPYSERPIVTSSAPSIRYFSVGFFVLLFFPALYYII